MMISKRRIPPWRWLAFHLSSLGISLLFLLPLVWMLAGSLRPIGAPPPRGLDWPPLPLAPLNYWTIFQVAPLGRYMLNSLLVTGLAIPLTLLSASWGGFALAQLGRPTRRLVTLSIALLLVPFTAFWLSRFLLFRWLGWIDSYLALLAPAFMGSSPLFVLLFYAAYRRIPPELFEAARLDGAGPLQGWRQIALPLGKSTSVAISLLTFMLYWNDFINPLLYLKSPRLYTLAVGLQQLQVLDQPNQPLLLAAAVLMTLPALLVYALLQHYLLGDRILGGS